MDEQATVEALRSSPFFAGLSDDDLVRITEMGEPVSFGEGERIIEKGTPGDAMYLLLWGTTEIEVGGRVHKPGAGQVVGEMALFSTKKRTATVTTTGPVEALKIPAERFHEFLLQNPSVAVGILEQVVERLREVQERVEAYWS
jgi:CRP/FNR family transcriptional regulator, cyclic AMP receptor protein